MEILIFAWSHCGTYIQSPLNNIHATSVTCPPPTADIICVYAPQEDDNFDIYLSELDPSDQETAHLITIGDRAEKLRLDSEWYGACYTTETKKDNQGGNSIGQD